MSRTQWTDDKLLERLLHNLSDKTYWDNIGELRRRPSQNLFEKCVQLASSENPKARRIAIDVLAQMGTTPRPFINESLEMFFNILKKEHDSQVLNSILFAIGHNNDNLTDNQTKQICSFKNTEDAAIKNALVFSLLGVDNKTAIATLIHFSKDRSSHIRNWAIFGLGTQLENDSPVIHEALWDRITDKNQDARFEAIAGLAMRKDERIAAVIYPILNSGNYPALLFEAISLLDDKQFLPSLKEQLLQCELNPNINPDWLDDLKQCIEALERTDQPTLHFTGSN